MSYVRWLAFIGRLMVFEAISNVAVASPLSILLTVNHVASCCLRVSRGYGSGPGLARKALIDVSRSIRNGLVVSAVPANIRRRTEVGVYSQTDNDAPTKIRACD